MTCTLIAGMNARLRFDGYCDGATPQVVQGGSITALAILNEARSQPQFTGTTFRFVSPAGTIIEIPGTAVGLGEWAATIAPVIAGRWTVDVLGNAGPVTAEAPIIVLPSAAAPMPPSGTLIVTDDGSAYVFADSGAHVLGTGA